MGAGFGAFEGMFFIRFCGISCISARFKRIQKIIWYDTNRQPRFLITPKAFREAGEAYAIMGGMDRQIAAQRAGHTLEVQARSYTKYDAIRARDLVDKHMPRFENGGI